VFLSAASINAAARQIDVVLRDVPSRAMCSELERFILQVRTELIAISGMKFFYMTRPMVLQVAAAVFTYELTMIQLDRNIVSGTDPDFCG
jgi:gustatory receptor